MGIWVKTLVGYVRRYQYLRDFMCEKFEDPSPLCISAPLIEDDFIAWAMRDRWPRQELVD